MRSPLALALGILAASGSVVAQPLGSKQVRVSIEFRDAGTKETDALQGSGRIVITERGPQGSRAGLGAGIAMKSRERDQVFAHRQEELGGMLLDHDDDSAADIIRLADDVVLEHARVS